MAIHPQTVTLGPSLPNSADRSSLLEPIPSHPIELTGSLGRLRLAEELGRGGMGVVYRAEDPGLQRQRAVKVMHSHLSADPKARERFLREARAAAAIDHPNVVPVYEVGEADDVVYMIMPLLVGKTLAEWSHGRTSLIPTRWLRAGAAVADGLAAAHAAGLVHRDVKPSNIWLDAGERPGTFRGARLLDFGLARPVGERSHLTETGEVLGTPGYMAPEQLDGRPVDTRADLFALGCVLYALATGRRPFDGATQFEVARKTAMDDPVPPMEINPLIPGGLSGFIPELLDKDPEQRPPSAGVVRDTLREIDAAIRSRADRVDTSGVAIPIVRPEPAPLDRPAWAWAGVVGGFLATVAAAAGASWWMGWM